ncbi:6518_t:CDS:2 [Dentiscutata heterogama]|uniref:6518_t:CDS:1 n=1 Tax=Dentiscutata heterogama TaxID=1316150 RepID=A0ACA9KWQ8_9GLOM|nr:6518_t:CDS:2 [Dentiscutata heterogama]
MGKLKRIKPSSRSSVSKYLTVNSNSLLCKLPPEILLNICKNLSPYDLISLSKVCKLFYNDLRQGDSLTIQQIWRESRLSFMHYRQMDPPDGMKERDYVLWLLDLRCEFCKKKTSLDISWEFRVRTCSKCLDENFVRHNDLSSSLISGIPTFILNCVPWKRDDRHYRIRIFREEQVIDKYKEFMSVSEHEREEWKKQQLDKVLQIQRDSKETNEDGSLKYNESILKSCPALHNAFNYDTYFSERAWKLLKGKLIKEHNIKEFS